MAYLINGTNLENYLLPIKQDGSDLALSGFLDLPARLGKCYNTWGASHGVEPYTNASEIRLGGRDLIFRGLVQGPDKLSCIEKLNSLYSLINTYDSLVTFSHSYGSHLVYVKDSIVADYINEYGITVTLIMREPEPAISGSIPSANSDYGIDGIDFSSLSSSLISIDGDRRNRTAGKSMQFTAFRKEGYQITKTDVSELDIKIFVRASSYTLFSNSIKSYQQLFINPGQRNLIVKNDLQRRIFACNGFKVTDIRNNDGWYGFLNITVIQSQLPQTITYLTDNAGNIITDSFNNKILIKWQ